MSSFLLREICDVIRERFDLRVDEAQPINRGYLNEKWILHTNRGTWFAKSYHPERYRKHLKTIWDEIDQALKLQIVYYRSGGDCPELLEYEERRRNDLFLQTMRQSFANTL
jgi:homoserine kinase type II